MDRITPFAFLLLLLMQGCTSAPTFEQELQEKFNRSFDASCQERVLEEAIRDFSTLSGIAAEHVSAEFREKVKENAAPLFARCTCLREKLGTKVDQESSTHFKVTMDGSVFFNALECMPSSEAVTRVSQGLLRLVLETPTPAQLMSTKREVFSIYVSASSSIDVSAKIQPSLFASYDRPPGSLRRLVFLAPATGSACGIREICIDKSSLEISSPSSNSFLSLL